MKNFVSLFFLLFSIFQLAAQSEYAAAKIPPSLLKNADVVFRRYELDFNVLNKGEAIETEHTVLTLLNAKAADYNEQVFYYSKIFEIEDIEGAIYDGAGNLVRRIKKKDIEDQKPFEQQFVDDYRYKIIHFPRLPFPYTIEYTVKRRYNGLLHYPVFEPQSSPEEAVEYARFELKMAPGLAARFKEKDLPQGSKTGALRWEFHNLQAFEPELFSPVGDWNLPRILTSPTLFSIEGYDGDMSSWQSLGTFIQKMNAGKDALSPETVAQLKALTADCPDTACKIRRVYEHLQSGTRYFFVGLGIGGWQPAMAAEVDQFKYGDCKGLSNYMVAMLQAVGVPAYYALIRAGEEEQTTQYPDFPNAWFNHATLCIPMGKDTMWLECTSQTESCGFLSDFTDDRPALVIFPEGGRLVQTPRYNETVNTIHHKTDIALADDGSATLVSTDVYRGIEQDIPSALAGLHDEKRKKYLYELLNLPDFEIKSQEFVRKKERLPEVQQNLELAIPRLASVSGKRLFLPVSVLSSKFEAPTADSSARRFSVQAHSRGMTEESDLTIAVPTGYVLENAFAPVSWSSPFGSFDLSVRFENGTVIVHRKLVLNNSIQGKERYGEFIAFLKHVAKTDKVKLVLVR